MNSTFLTRSLRAGRLCACLVACVLWLGAPSAARADWHGGSGHSGGGFGGFHHGGGGFFHGGHGFRGGDDFSFSLGLGFGGYYSPYYYDAYPYYYPDVVYVPAYTPPAVIYTDPPEVVVVPRDRSYQGSRGSSSQSYDDNDYYLNRRARPLQRDASLTEAIGDIESAFRTKNGELLEKHVAAGEDIAVLAKGHDRRTMKGSDYVTVTRGAFKDMDTVSFSLPNVSSGADGTWRVSGTHVIHSSSGDKTFDVLFVLKKHEGRWVIAEVSANVRK